MTFSSAIYAGAVMHRRLTPRVHRFRYRGFWLLLDLDELEHLPGKLALFSRNRFNAFGLYDRDHGDGSDQPLREQIGRKLSQAGIAFDSGKIRLLCMPRMFGYAFNPLSVFFCADRSGAPVAIVYEVHNTFGERHSYVVPVAGDDGMRHACDKAFYVSPFLDMDMRYDFTVSQPGERLTVSIRASQGGAPVMIACLAGKRRILTDWALLRLLLTMPAVTFKVTAAIHWEALRLWLKGLRIRPHRSLSSVTASLPQTSSKD